jgi:hypothetical protein
MLTNKKKLCQGCQQMTYIWSKKLCKNCHSKTYKSKIKPVSESLKNKLIIYNKLRLEYLDKHPVCQANIYKCTTTATEIHHKQGRVGNLLNDTTKWLAVCRSCHTYITVNPKEAIEKGLSIKRT